MDKDLDINLFLHQSVLLLGHHRTDFFIVSELGAQSNQRIFLIIDIKYLLGKQVEFWHLSVPFVAPRGPVLVFSCVDSSFSDIQYLLDHILDAICFWHSLVPFVATRWVDFMFLMCAQNPRVFNNIFILITNTHWTKF